MFFTSLYTVVPMPLGQAVHGGESFCLALSTALYKKPTIKFVNVNTFIVTRKVFF